MRIKSIIPAPGFVAVFESAEDVPLACWALLELDPDELNPHPFDVVVGMFMVEGEPFLNMADEDDGFQRYKYERPRP